VLGFEANLGITKAMNRRLLLLHLKHIAEREAKQRTRLNRNEPAISLMGNGARHINSRGHSVSNLEWCRMNRNELDRLIAARRSAGTHPALL
jgi:hypothetical protein